jgi:hypothetical protein
MTCCASSEFKCEEINGSCPVCGEPTVDGDAYESCFYSPVACEECGNAPCDGSC